MQWTALVPVKANAKSRLDADPLVRARLSRAFLADVLEALTSTQAIDQVLVVTDDPGIAQDLAERVHTHLTSARGLNAELTEALQTLGARPAAILAADLPCVTVESIDCVLELAAQWDRSFVTDAQGLGTTMLLAHDAGACTPMFGARSHARHAQAGYHELRAQSADQLPLLARARRDVDTPLDLWDAVRLGIGPASAVAMP